MKVRVSTQAEITDWRTVIAAVCRCGHGHQITQCAGEDCDCSGCTGSNVDLLFSPTAQTWGLRAGGDITVLPKDRGRRTSRQLRVAAIRAATA
ncbi:hypothetical protein [Streptomyces sp. NPDC059786]|uniref:hypothetical protein n=1 Tax=Streptomyces sp. NPDC059786 TaxID=3346946 RepID=UPI0036643DE2